MRTLPTIALDNLPLPPVIEPIAYEDLLAAIVTEFKARWETRRAANPDLPAYDVELLETDPAKILLESGAFIYMLALARVNDAARALMLATATGGDLEAFATDFGLQKLTITPATDDAPAVLESDRDFRLRRQLAPEAYAAAGPGDAYRFFALSADASIKQALALKGDANRIDLVLLSRDGDGTVDTETIAKVHEALSPHLVRPLTDALYTRSAEIVGQAIHVVLTVPHGPDRETVRARAESQIAAYAAARHAIGTALRVDGIIGAARENNAIETMQVVAPAVDVEPGIYGAVHVTGITVEVAA